MTTNQTAIHLLAVGRGAPGGQFSADGTASARVNAHTRVWKGLSGIIYLKMSAGDLFYCGRRRDVADAQVYGERVRAQVCVSNVCDVCISDGSGNPAVLRKHCTEADHILYKRQNMFNATEAENSSLF